MRLAHGWGLSDAAGVPDAAVRDFFRPAVRAVPPAMARRLPPCRITLVPDFGGRAVASEWRDADGRISITVAVAGIAPHDAALDVLLCVGQALWERLKPAEFDAWWRLLLAEVRAAVAGEIDEQALREKRSLLAGRAAARSRTRLERYARAAFAGTAAEYVHCLWHDVTVRTGPEHLPAPELRERLELLAGWFPPGRGYRLFP